ncbi:MAG: adenylosuccinate lyase [Actinomycetia bacterium]|nr:adenylosuccinate lyase [Actinomycetes bacterium]MCP4958579.1 adenylosuccinate lyase [Actinomycetes bacterium]
MGNKAAISNVLADRYASSQMCEIWSPRAKVVREREFWIAVLEAQREAGLDVPQEVVDAYRREIDNVDLDSIREREHVTLHDVKARIEEFCALAGYEHIHKGLTSRDLTENVEQLQVRDAVLLTRRRVITVLARLGVRASEYSSLVMTGRSHNVAAQATTLGKRFATIADELITGLERLDSLVETHRLRGIKGPVGTQLDQVDLLGSTAAATELEGQIASHLGFERTFDSVGQVYPRSLDLDVVAALCQVVSSVANLALVVRLMAGAELLTEGFRPGQVGSSAMPHKMNTRSTERISGFMTILRGHLTMASGLAGDQWNEGDVSCSVVRRVVLPDAFFAADGALQTAATVLDDLGAYPEMVEREFERYLPFLATTKLLTAAVKAGVGREQAHEIIKGHAISAAIAMREQASDNTMIVGLADDPAFPLDHQQIDQLLADPIEFAGLAESQVKAVLKRIESIVSDDPRAAAEGPEPIL